MANKMINGKQDDQRQAMHNFMAHGRPQHVVCGWRGIEGVLDLLQEQHGKEAPLVINQGKSHDYLGMTLDFSEDGKVKVMVMDWIDDMIDKVPEDMTGEAATPASNHLFNVNNQPEESDEDTAQMFHHNTAKLMFLSK
jgi:hypothetical protein